MPANSSLPLTGRRIVRSASPEARLRIALPTSLSGLISLYQMMKMKIAKSAITRITVTVTRGLKIIAET